MGNQKVKAFVIHISQNFSRPLFRWPVVCTFHLHFPGFGFTWFEFVPESGERQLQLLVIPGHKDRGLFTHKLKIAESRSPNTESAPELLGDRYLDNYFILTGGQPAAFFEAIATPEFKPDGLALNTTRN